LFYRGARFFSVDEVTKLMQTAGFKELSSAQTLFRDELQIQTPDPVRPGHGEGSFVVIRGTKPQEGSAKVSS
jgi:hypothetical protein